MATTTLSLLHSPVVSWDELHPTTQEVFADWIATTFKTRVDSMVRSAVAKLIVEGTERKASKVDNDELTRWHNSHPSESANLTEDCAAELFEHVREGTIPTRGDGQSQLEKDTREAAKRLMTVLFTEFNKRNAEAIAAREMAPAGFPELAKGRGVSKESNDQIRAANESAIDQFLSLHAVDGGKYETRFKKMLAAVQAESAKPKSDMNYVANVAAL